MFLKNAEVKQKWQSILNDYAFKSGANKKAFKITTTLNKRREGDELLPSDADISMGCVEKFVEVMRLQKKLSKISAEIKANNWSTAWSLLWGNELYNRSVVYVNSFSKDCSSQLWMKKQKKTGWKVP